MSVPDTAVEANHDRSGFTVANAHFRVMSDDDRNGNGDKDAAAAAAVDEVREGMLVGLGTGSTAAFAIRRLGVRVTRGLSIRAVATSNASAALARSAGIEVIDFADVAQVDLTIDGVDEIAPDLTAIKGAGGAMLREKIVAAASRRMIVIADGSKPVDRLGGAKLPVEVLPFARAAVTATLDRWFARVTLRSEIGHSYLTDNGNFVFDCHEWRDNDPQTLAAALSATPGVVGHGLFLTEVAAAYIARDGVVTRVERDGSSG